MNSVIKRPCAEPIHVAACPHPFKVEQKKLEISERVSIAQVLEDVQVDPILRKHAKIFINGDFVPRERWGITYPSPGDFVSIRVVPTGGGGGGKNPLRTVLTIAVIAASFAAAPLLGAAIQEAVFFSSLPFGVSLGGATAFAGALISLGGALIVNAIAPPSTPKLPELSGSVSGQGDSQTLSITGARNSINRFGPVPVVLGKHRVYPVFGAKQITEIQGDDQYLRILLVWGYGPLTISDIKIGETLITSFSDVEIETIEGDEVDQSLTLYPDTITETSVGATLNEVDAATERTTEADIDEISVDISFLQGLVKFAGGGQKQDQSVDVLVEYRVTSPPGSWTTAGTISTTARQSSVVRKSLRWSVTRDQYDVRLHRETGDTSDTQIFDTVTWSILRSIKNEDPIVPTGLAKTAIRIKATDQLNGFIDTINGICQSQVKDWNGSTWVVGETQNPASLAREVLQGAANARPLADSRIDLTQIQNWHDFCVTKGFKYNAVIDYRTTVHEILQDIAAAGRASLATVDGKKSFVIDESKTTPVQVFTPKNSSGFRGNRVYTNYPHAWRFRFINENEGYKNDERIVPFEGYTESTATEFLGLEISGCTDPSLIYKHGKYHEAVLKLRPETYSFTTDIEALVCKRGDLIRVNHDIPLFGAGSARIKTITVDVGGDVTDVTLDDSVVMVSGNSYSARIRTSDGDQVVAAVDLNVGEQTSLTFTTPIDVSNGVAIGDLLLFGITGSESVEMLIRSIEPGEDLTARITGVDAAPAVWTADDGTIPTFNSQITAPPSLDQPVVTSVRSDSSVALTNPDGSVEIIALISLGLVNLLDLDRVLSLQVRYRQTGSDGPYHWTSDFDPDSREIAITGVEEGETYNFELRYAYKNGDYSSWTITSSHQITGVINNPRNEKLLNWPGTLVDCHINPQNNLVSNGNAAISTLPAMISLLADTIRDVVASKSPITYTTPTIDLGSDITITPRVQVTADDGTVTNTMQTGTSSDGAPTGSFVALASVTARYFKLKTSVAAGAVAARITEMLLNLDTITKEENYESINIATESNVWFERIAAGHFKIETKGDLEAISVARVDSFIGTGGGYSAEIVSTNTTLTARSVVAAEIKVYAPVSVITNITSSSVANPTNILCAAAHGAETGDEVLISGHTGSTPSINGLYKITKVDSTNFTIPVNVTTGGTGGTVEIVRQLTDATVSISLIGPRA